MAIPVGQGSPTTITPENPRQADGPEGYDQPTGQVEAGAGAGAGPTGPAEKASPKQLAHELMYSADKGAWRSHYNGKIERRDGDLAKAILGAFKGAETLTAKQLAKRIDKDFAGKDHKLDTGEVDKMLDKMFPLPPPPTVKEASGGFFTMLNTKVDKGTQKIDAQDAENGYNYEKLAKLLEDQKIDVKGGITEGDMESFVTSFDANHDGTMADAETMVAYEQLITAFSEPMPTGPAEQDIAPQDPTAPAQPQAIDPELYSI